MTFEKLGRYWQLARHIKPVWFYGCVWFRLHRPRAKETVFIQTLRVSRRHLENPAARAVFILGLTQFRFFKQAHTLPALGAWNEASFEKLGLYNLHYFDDLNVPRCPLVAYNAVA